MTAVELLARLHELDVYVRAEGDTLWFGPSERVTPDLLAAARSCEPELLALIAAKAMSATWSDDPPAAQVTGVLTDPRPDLAEDSAAWGRLLYLARGVDAEFAATLSGFRCCGARLGHQKGSWRIYPLLDLTERRSAWQDHASYERDREKWLLPFRSALTSLLGMLPAPETASIQPQPAAQKAS